MVLGVPCCKTRDFLKKATLADPMSRMRVFGYDRATNDAWFMIELQGSDETLSPLYLSEP